MKKAANGQFVISLLESFAPKKMAVEGDPIGLQVGSLNRPVKKVMIALDVLEPVVDEAIEKEVDLIIAHHPLLYRPLKKIDTNTSKGRVIEKLIKNEITVYAAHTNLDVTARGVNEWLSKGLELQQTEVLAPTYEEQLIKLSVFVPVSHEEAVRQALGDAGAGHIGNYSHCSFSTNGWGSFKPLEGTNPYIGEQGKIERTEEVRLESIFPATIQNSVLSAMKKAHPYEEVAFDLYPLLNKGTELGIGKIGKLDKEMTIDEFVQHVKDAFGISGVRVIKGHDHLIKKVAVVGGDGNKYIYPAVRKGADVLVTGDIYYHNAHDAQEEGLTIIDAGHHIEEIMKTELKDVLEKELSERKYDTTVIESTIRTEPFTFM
ncbi:Nif3-like dinuclear metal center hexameric protein [Fictibacillus phosphorivorans]|uniref:Nif3-like dinuclear metal center hexameric protein n=1 Tax=Fictibacillus phosphorivorans TaxID=1221500 RepID=UPI00203CB739|nr:Nif3-like dinuclear metal center hexameric protein [Fictibacillus phosphorivorans]MCM3716850.1 Nif3-like dinuclear metal center hexameric protein [Fictibacillus phosphorivorans]MCM3774601.1 Nif3-like dinuclear metal center hexameric protein [Fictibacillus phosphorivorans]